MIKKELSEDWIKTKTNIKNERKSKDSDTNYYSPIQNNESNSNNNLLTVNETNNNNSRVGSYNNDSSNDEISIENEKYNSIRKSTIKINSKFDKILNQYSLETKVDLKNEINRYDKNDKNENNYKNNSNFNSDEWARQVMNFQNLKLFFNNNNDIETSKIKNKTIII
jgi:hypothetical protein